MQQSLAVIKYYAGIFNVLPPFIHALVKDLRHTVLAIWLFLLNVVTAWTMRCMHVSAEYFQMWS